MQLNRWTVIKIETPAIFLQKKTGMKKITFSIALSVLSLASFAQKTIVVNGGRFGSSPDISVTSYDVTTQTSTLIDSIHSQSVQDVIIEGSNAYVMAQDSIVMYDLSQGVRTAATSFNGPSTKTALIGPNNELLVGNWYSKTSDNVYIYDATTLALKDSISAVAKGAKSMILNGGELYITQNLTSSTWSDSAGYVIRINVATRTVIDTMTVSGYSGDIGEIVARPDGSGFFTINSVSNTISSFDFVGLTLPVLMGTNTSFNANFSVGDRSDYTVHNDTAFIKTNRGVGAINLDNLTLIDSNIVDTVVTAFTYDTLNRVFYVTQTDFISFISGRAYDRSGNYLRSFPVDFSPEVISMYYDQVTGIFEAGREQLASFAVYPNPATTTVNIELNEVRQEVQRLEIFNLKGQLMHSSTVVGTMNRINVEQLTRGIYFVRISTNNASSIQKLIIE